MRRQKFLWFQLAALAGAGLAVLLVLETFLTYRYSATRLARAEALFRAIEEVSALEHRLRRGTGRYPEWSRADPAAGRRRPERGDRVDET